MNSFKSKLIVLGTVGLLFLGACSSNGNQAANTKNSPGTTSTSTAQSSASPAVKTEEHGKTHGGQVVETGAYHLEFVPEKEANKTHMDFYLLNGDNHEIIPNAKVTAIVQLPDGTQKTLPMTYDASDKHYTALLAGNTPGQYQVKVSSDLNGKKVDGRFNFSK